MRFDDPYTLHQNPRLNPPTLAGVASYWRQWQHGEMGLYIPVTYTAWSALAAVGRLDQPDAYGIALNPQVFHAANIIVHAAAALIVFELLSLLVGNRAAAFAGACLFALYPMQVEPVAWASGLKDLLSATLALLSILLYLRATQDRPRVSWKYFAALAAYALALLAKPSAIVAAPICIILDIMQRRRSFTQTVRLLTPWLILAVPVVLIARYVQVVDHVKPVPLYARPLIAADALVFYLGKLLAPIDLAIDYGRRPEVILASPLVYVIWLVPVLLAVAIARLRDRTIAAAAIVFVVALLPVLGLAAFQFQQFSTVADHYAYLAMFGPALALADVMSRFRARRAWYAAGAVLIVLAARSFAQTAHWRDDFALLRHTIDVNRASFFAHNNLGTAYEGEAGVARKDGRLPDATRFDRAALHQYEQAVVLNPDYTEAWRHMAQVARRLGDDTRAARADEALRARAHATTQP